MSHRKPFAVCVLTLCLFIRSGQAQDMNRLERDLRIMEGILEKLITSSEATRHFDYSKGLFIDNFGVIFHIDRQNPYTSHMVFERTASTLRSLAEAERMYEVQVLGREGKQTGDSTEAEHAKKARTEDLQQRLRNYYPVVEEENQEEIIRGLKENILHFYRTYSSTLQLQNQDRIAVLVQLNGQSQSSENAFLSSCIRRNDIQRLKRREIDETAFDGLISFTLTSSKSAISKDMEILSEILERGLESADIPVQNVQRGIYLDGFGVLYFIESPGMMWSNSYFSFYNPKEDMLTIQKGKTESGKALAVTSEGQVKDIQDILKGMEQRATEEEQKRQEMREEYRKNLENQLFELIASYGHTLHLKSDEWVVLNIDLDNRMFVFPGKPQAQTHFTLQFQKKDLDDYYESRIDAEQLRKKVITRSF